MANNQPQRKEPPAILLLLWAILCLAMWFWAIAGTLFVVLGIASFFINLDTLHIGISGIDGAPVRTPEQKVMFIAVGAVLAIVGIGFQCLRKRGYLKYGDWLR